MLLFVMKGSFVGFTLNASSLFVRYRKGSSPVKNVALASPLVTVCEISGTLPNLD